MTSEETSRPNILARVLQGLPVISYVVRCLEEERHGEFALAATNLLMAAIVGVLACGYPFL
ncbi:MAG: hypothetical protein ACK5JT_11760, partial [Hyphomicrobiaceae bacterium]